MIFAPPPQACSIQRLYISVIKYSYPAGGGIYQERTSVLNRQSERGRKRETQQRNFSFRGSTNKHCIGLVKPELQLALACHLLPLRTTQEQCALIACVHHTWLVMSLEHISVHINRTKTKAYRHYINTIFV